jgi:hypothetical protein
MMAADDSINDKARFRQCSDDTLAAYGGQSSSGH